MFDPTDHYAGREAETYDDVRSGAPKWQREQEIVSGFLAELEPRSVLDVPVGTGRFLPVYTADHVIGVDISEDMLDEARRQPSTAGSLVLNQGDITRLEVADEAVDVTVCIRFANLVSIDVVEAAIGELARVTRSHVILGIRTRPAVLRPHRDPVGAHLRHLVYRARGNVRAAIKGGRKVRTHLEAVVEEVFTRSGLGVARREVVDRWPDGSTYRIYLLHRAAATQAGT